MKVCTKCQATKPLGDFHRDRKRSDGRSSWCIECRRAYQRSQPRRAHSFTPREVVVIDGILKAMLRGERDLTTFVRAPEFAGLARKFAKMREVSE